MRRSTLWLLAALALTAGAPQLSPPVLAMPQADIDGFTGRVFGRGLAVMPYRLFLPVGYDPRKHYPLIVWLHGAGGAGDDNQRQLAGDQIPGTRTWTQPAVQAAHPAFVLVPQAALGWGAQGRGASQLDLPVPLALVLGIVDSLPREFSIDSTRVYLAGQSDGGYGVWSLMTRAPERFAAAIVLCGGGDPTRAERATHRPMWIFHGDRDRSVPVKAARDMVAAVRKAGGTPRYTEYKGAGHDIWTRVFVEPGLVEWLFAQHN